LSDSIQFIAVFQKTDLRRVQIYARGSVPLGYGEKTLELWGTKNLQIRPAFSGPTNGGDLGVELD